MLHKYVVVYLVCGTHYRYRCIAKNKREAEKECRENMGVEKEDIVETYMDEPE